MTGTSTTSHTIVGSSRLRIVPQTCPVAPPTLVSEARLEIIPGMRSARFWNSLGVGMESTTSRVRTSVRWLFCTSTTGLAPVTVMVSATSPTRMSALTVAVKPDVNSRPSRLTEPKPVNANVTV